jgi:hypothetical protein
MCSPAEGRWYPQRLNRHDGAGGSVHLGKHMSEMVRLPGFGFGHFKPIHVKSGGAIYLRSLLNGRRQLVSAVLKIENTIRGMLRTYGLKIENVMRRVEELIPLTRWRMVSCLDI